VFGESAKTLIPMLERELPLPFLKSFIRVINTRSLYKLIHSVQLIELDLFDELRDVVL